MSSSISDLCFAWRPENWNGPTHGSRLRSRQPSLEAPPIAAVLPGSVVFRETAAHGRSPFVRRLCRAFGSCGLIGLVRYAILFYPLTAASLRQLPRTISAPRRFVDGPVFAVLGRLQGRRRSRPTRARKAADIGFMQRIAAGRSLAQRSRAAPGPWGNPPFPGATRLCQRREARAATGRSRPH